MNFKALLTATAAILALSAVSCKSDSAKSPPEVDYAEAVRTTASTSVQEGKETVTMPDVSGMTSALAQDMLRMLGLECEIKNSSSDKVQPGYVIRTEPEPDTEVKKGETITIYVSE